MDHTEGGAKRKRFAQIAALALIWGIGILAVICERSADAPAHHSASASVAR